jgi:hypothetical protein
MWIGFAWGLLYGVIECVRPSAASARALTAPRSSISSIFRQLHHFGTGAVGTVYICMTLGSLLGFSVWQVQERLYTRYHATRGPEARLHTACGAAVLFPAGMFVYAWCAYPSVPWIGLCVGIVVRPAARPPAPGPCAHAARQMFMTAVFNIYCGVFSYLADCYGPFASSALAGQSLARNIMGTAFPLFTTQLYGARPRPRVAARDGDADAPAHTQMDLGSAGATRSSRSSPRRSRPSRTYCSSTARSSARGASSPGRWCTTIERGATGAQVRRHFARYPKEGEIDRTSMQGVKYIANDENASGVRYSVPESHRIACRIMYSSCATVDLG